jgi:hypothetical protein
MPDFDPCINPINHIDGHTPLLFLPSESQNFFRELISQRPISNAPKTLYHLLNRFNPKIGTLLGGYSFLLNL